MNTQRQIVIRRQGFLKSEGESSTDLKAESQVETNGVPSIMGDCLKSGQSPRALIELLV